MFGCFTGITIKGPGRKLYMKCSTSHRSHSHYVTCDYAVLHYEDHLGFLTTVNSLI